MLRDELRERDEEARLQSGLTVVWRSVPAGQLRDASMHLDSPGILDAEHEVEQPREAESDDVSADDSEEAEADRLLESPYSLEVSARKGQGHGGDDQLRVSPTRQKFSPFL